MPDQQLQPPPHPYQEWRVLSVRSGKTVDNPKGPGQLTAFYVDFEGVEDGWATPDGVYWRRKSDNEPKMGDRFWGEISLGEYGYKMAWDNTKETSPGGAQTASKPDFKAAAGQPRSQTFEAPDARQRSIIEQHSQEMAVRCACAAGYFSGEIGQQELDGNLAPLIDWFAKRATNPPDNDQIPF